MKRKILVFALLLSLLITIIPTTISMFGATSAALPYTEIFGTLNGADYVIRIPNPLENWNRNLVVYCHGYSHLEVNVSAFITSSNLGMDKIIANGYAVAASTYGAGGYCVQKGINSTYQLTQYLISNYNVTGKVFLYGISMGGNIALLTSQKYPQLYSGVLDLSGSKDLADAYNTKIDFLAAKDDNEMASKLQAINAPVPPYPFSVLVPPPLSLQLKYWRDYCNQSAADIALECGGTPQNALEVYIKDSPTGNANISRPVITVHGNSDALVPISQTLKYQAAVAAAGRSNLYRLYTIPSGQHVDAPITNEVIPRLLELNAWSNSLDGWTLVTDARAMKAYPDLREYIWQKNASMPPNGLYDKIGLHRLVKTGTAPKGVIFVAGCPMWGMGEQRISNPTTDNWTKTENYSSPIYWANRGYDVYAIDYRTNFIPNTLNSSQMAFAANWGLDVWVSDIKEAAEKVKEVSGTSKFFISGECSGGEAALNYAAKYWKDDLRGIILLDANYPGVSGYPIVGKTAETNTYNMTKAIADMNAAGTFAYDSFRTLRPVASYALQNPSAPAAYPPGSPLNPPLNPITNNTWANITEWFASRVQNSFDSPTIPPGAFSNLAGGYGDISQVEYCFANNQFLPSRLTIETLAMADWANCPYLTYDYNDHYSEIGVPVLAYAGPYVNQTGAFRFMLGINNTDFTGNYMPKYGHLDILFGTFSARDISQPALDWMLSRYQSPVALASSPNPSLITGQTATVTVSVSGGVPPYTYQWYEGTNVLLGQTTVQLTVTKTAPGTYTYYCSILDAERTTTASNTVTLSVALPPTPTPTPTVKPSATIVPTPTPTVPPPTTEPTTTPAPTQSPIPQPSTALPTETIYAVVAIAVIIIVSISVLALKKRAK